jgi:4-amino-4-deoxy-L-arabinose transferase-like glycosyltransferase
VRELLRRNLRFFLLASAAAFVLRLIFLLRFPGVVNDSFIYGDIAKNWLQHGTYGLSGPDEISPTYIRLPGYPAFLAFIFAVFGMEHYRTVLVVQMFIDVGTCFLCADIALRWGGPRFAKTAFVLTALCPFLADYSAAALTETLEIFFTALALDFALRGLQIRQFRYWAGCGISCAAATLLRPDGTLLVIAIAGYLIWKSIFQQPAPETRKRFLQAAVIVLIFATAPLIPWALRNWNVFHRFQPLAPRYANEEDEFVPMGFNHWVKSWIVDYVSVEEIYWPVPGSPIDVAQLPARAADNPKQWQKTSRLIGEYNAMLHVSEALDKKFEALASKRISSHRFRYYIQLPVLRVADMWLRPRTEMLPCDSRWWEFNDEPQWSALAIFLGVANLFYVACALLGWVRHRRTLATGLLVLFILVRSAFLSTLENPEPRYTLEMYPVVIVLAAAGLLRQKTAAQPAGSTTIEA